MYWMGGALVDRMNGPGWHWMMPGVYSRDFVQLTLQTDSVRDIPCGTSTGGEEIEKWKENGRNSFLFDIFFSPVTFCSHHLFRPYRCGESTRP